MSVSQKEQKALEIDIANFRKKLSVFTTRMNSTVKIGLEAGQNDEKVIDFKVRFSKVEEMYVKYQTILDDLRTCCVRLQEEESFEGDEVKATEFERLYFDALKIDMQFSIKKEALANNSLSQVNSGPSLPSVRLPKINLPHFTGSNLSDWPHFKDVFQSLVHNNDSLSNIEKFYFLIGSLSEPALGIVKTLPVIDTNYEQAWQALNKRYDNVRILATHYLENIFNFRPLQGKPSLSSLQSYLSLILENAAAFRSMHVKDEAGFILLIFSLRLLDPQTRAGFEDNVVDKDIPTFDNLFEFIGNRCRIMEVSSVGYGDRSLQAVSSKSVSKPQKMGTTLLSTSKEKLVCPSCSKEHNLFRCPSFLRMDTNNRFRLVKASRICYNCLSSTHLSSKCKSSSGCKQCNQRHHTLLHFTNRVQNNEQPIVQQPPVEAQLSTSTVISNYAQSSATVLLGTAVVNALDCKGSLQPIRVVIDPGSHLSFITKTCANRLGLQGRRCDIPISCLAETAMAGGGKSMVTCNLLSRFSSNSPLNVDAIILPTITSNLPTTRIPNDVRDRFCLLQLADPEFWTPGPVDFLLGSDVYLDILPKQALPTIHGKPGAYHTKLGWVITGKVSDNVIASSSTSLFTVECGVEHTLRKFWELEEPCPIKVANPDDVSCEEQFRLTHTRDITGRYIVALPFKNSPNLREFEAGALSRFKRLEFKLSKNPQLKQDYHKFMQEYIDLGHMQIAEQPAAYIIPHHSVVKEDSSSTKLRVVFDGSYKCVNGSLNDCLLAGPKLQLDIRDILYGFRLNTIAFTTDICKMYRQILIREDDRKFQHIMFRFDSSQPVSEYQLNTVTYGLAPSPYLAMRVLRQLAEDEGPYFPLAAKVLRDSVYVDDIVTGANSIEEVLELQRQLIGLLGRGGFELKKWTSNCPQVLSSVPSNHREQPFSLSGDDPVYKVLGLQWDPHIDCFSYKICHMEPVYTKRAILSNIGRIFDPLGWLSPVVFRAKHILQRIWHEGLGWDDLVSQSISDDWKEMLDQLSLLESVKIPRHIDVGLDGRVDVLAFCDASERGYAAVVYLRTTDVNMSPRVYLLAAKTKLAPLKTISIPKLELCAAVLLSRMLETLQPFLNNLQLGGAFLFSDSTIVLSWFRISPHLLKTFVANRVTTVLEKTCIDCWYHIPSAQNPADCASRGLTPSSLCDTKLWWYGPDWMLLSKDSWLLNKPVIKKSNLPEVKGDPVTLLTTEPSREALTWIENVSSFNRMQHMMAYILRFSHNLRAKPTHRLVGPLTVSEIRRATFRCLLIVQQSYFADEVSQLMKGSMPANLMRLSPFIDSDGLLRVGGRLRHSSLNFDAKHPILLPQKSHFTKLLIDHSHRLYLHAGPQLLQSLICRNYWILSARRIIRQRIHQCTICYRLSAKPLVTMMGDLPSSRFQQGRPFIHVGCDFAGPFNIKESLRRNAKISKAYLCIFVCLSTKAVHLEAVSDLSSDAFLAALDRFVARRGLCSNIYSDCGTNFVGAARLLKEFFVSFRDSQYQTVVKQHLAHRNIQWHFNPPAAPHFGGLWEAGVKSAKFHLVRIASERSFTFEELTTLFARIEAILNSRPLCPLSSSSEEFNCLTPGHFLIGAPILAVPEETLEDIPVNRLNRWQLIRQFSQHFWKRWSTEYLHTLQQRTKWTTSSKNLEKGSLVLLFDKNSSPLDWKIGRIEETHPGKDQVVRVVTVKTTNGFYKRPITKLVTFPPPSQEN